MDLIAAGSVEAGERNHAGAMDLIAAGSVESREHDRAGAMDPIAAGPVAVRERTPADSVAVRGRRPWRIGPFRPARSHRVAMHWIAPRRGLSIGETARSIIVNIYQNDMNKRF